MPQAMIVSLGGSPEPLIKTLSEQCPQIVCFLASQESVDLVGKVKDGATNAGVSFRDHKVLVEVSMTSRIAIKRLSAARTG